MDALAAADGQRIAGANLGRVVLPSSHTGSPRCMAQLYQDAMAIVADLGSPDLFVTFTCNPHWSDIEKALEYLVKKLDGSGYDKHKIDATYRPDIVSIVFHLKLRELLDLLTKKHVFGKVKGFMYTIEFQKRGLPHAHILLIMEDGHKPDPAKIDDYVCAELPDPIEEPVLFEVVTKCMLHGPCGDLNPDCPCMENGRCSKKYPRPFTETTTILGDGYPCYRRRRNGRSVMVYVKGCAARDGQPARPGQHVAVDNRWVVPYNKRLSHYFRAHINVEICSSVRAIKYIYKYIYKGSDRARIALCDTLAEGEQVDEILVFLTARFISPPEARWRIFGFPLHGRSPAIMRLAVHEENQQSVVVDSVGNVGLEDVEAAGDKLTTLLGWFEANKRDDAIGQLARTLTYIEFPTQFVWNKKDRVWTLRSRGKMIGRMYFVHPTEGERFYLRMVLQVQRGATCFADLRTVDGVVYDSYRGACRALGLLSDDDEWMRTLREAAQFQTGRQLRELFACMLQFCIIGDPGALFQNHRQALSEDLLHRERVCRGDPGLELTQDELDVFALWDIELILRDAGKSLNDYPPLQTPNPPPVAYVQPDNPLIREQLDLNTLEEQEFALTAFDSLNDDQRHAVSAVETALDRNDGRGAFFFVDGPGGTGKTHVYRVLLARVRRGRDIALAVASSGNAALLLLGGRTAHSMFKIPIHVQVDSHCTISAHSQRAELLRVAKLVVWDEASMVHRHVLEAFERTCRSIRQSDALFGGLVVVMGGDFRQTLPVVPQGTREDLVAVCIRSSVLWRNVQVLRLTINMRVRAALANAAPERVDVVRAEVERHAEWLLSIGNGTHVDSRLDGEEFPRVALPHQFRLPTLSLDALIDRVYPGLAQRFIDNTLTSAWLLERAILAPLNTDIHAINAVITRGIPGEEKVYVSSDSVQDASAGETMLYTTEYLNSLHPNGFPPHRLVLKLGMPIMLIRNMNPKVGMCNGTRMIVVSLSRNLIVGRIMGGRFEGRTVFVPRVDLISDEDRYTPFKLRRRQFPVVAAWAMTINKAQGQTLSSVGVYLSRSVFSHGQLYVAFSRSSSVGGIAVACPSDVEAVTNVVYPEVL